MSKTKRTADAIEIIENRLKNDPELASMVEEERRKLGMAEKIRAARNSAGLTQKEVARLTGCAQSSIARLESGDYDRLSLNVLLKVTSALNCRMFFDLMPVGK